MAWLQKLTRYHRYGLRTDALWLLVILAGLTFYTSLTPLPPNDFWWHLKIGEVIARTGVIPTTNMFGGSLPADQPFVYGAWLGEYLFYWLYHWGQLPLVIFTRNALLLLTYTLLGYEAQRRTRSGRLAALTVLLAYLMTINNVIVRPQNWSWPVFALYLTLLSRYHDGALKKGWLLLLPVLMAFWVNVHGAFVLGIVLIGAFCVGMGLERLLKQSDARSWTEIRWLAFVGVLTGLATILNPQGIGIFQYVLKLMTDQPSQTLIVEWQSPSPHGVANTVFFISILWLLLVLWYSQYRPRPAETLLIVGFLWLAWSGIRYIVWYGLVVMPILAQAVSGWVRREWLVGTVGKNLLNVGLAVCIFLPVIGVQPWLLDDIAWPFPETYTALLHSDTEVGPLLSADTPVAVARYLAEHPGGPLFNEMGYGSYFIWALPEQKVFIDPRVELYPYEQWQDYIKITHGVRYNALLDQYGVERIVLDRERQEDLSLALETDPRWRQVYADAHAQVWDKQ
ncbi:MAG TPA: hypothetical protein PKH77_01835 [Anaerolineae bacterium]|nr:hypothetical protein [Anaerolineae bacterium]